MRTQPKTQERSYVGRQPSHLRLGLRERGVRRFAEMVFSNSGCDLFYELICCGMEG